MRHIAFVECNVTGSGFQGLRLAKEFGLHVTFLTRSRQQYYAIPGAQAFLDAYVDTILESETNDPEAVLTTVACASRLPPFDALMTFAEYYVPIVAEVARRLDLPGVDPQAAQRARNKLWTREHCQRAGVPIPRFASACTVDEAVAVAEEVGFPCVVKPVDESASLDVLLCSTPSEVQQHFQKIKSATVNFRDQPRFPRVLIEEYLLGHEVSVETLTWDAQTTVLGVTDKHLSGVPYFVEIGHVFPSCLPAPIVLACESMAKSALSAIGFDFGVAHVELKITEEGPRLIEINPRAAGDRITDLVEYSLGVPFLREIVRMHLGEVPNVAPCTHMGAAIRFLTVNPGIVKSVRGEELARRLPGIVELAINVRPGSQVHPLRKSLDRAGYIIATAETSYLASRLAESALLQIVIATDPVQE